LRVARLDPRLAPRFERVLVRRLVPDERPRPLLRADGVPRERLPLRDDRPRDDEDELPLDDRPDDDRPRELLLRVRDRPDDDDLRVPPDRPRLVRVAIVSLLRSRQGVLGSLSRSKSASDVPPSGCVARFWHPTSASRGDDAPETGLRRESAP
jgi:hypothetical protein